MEDMLEKFKVVFNEHYGTHLVSKLKPTKFDESTNFNKNDTVTQFPHFLFYCLMGFSTLYLHQTLITIFSLLYNCILMNNNR